MPSEIGEAHIDIYTTQAQDCCSGYSKRSFISFRTHHVFSLF